MKKIYLLLFSIAAYISFAQLPNCNNYYAQVGAQMIQSSTGIPNTSTLSTINVPGSGLAIGPNFGFPAPNPTYWTTSGGTYWYHNGAAWVNTGQSNGAAGAVNPGGSKNFIYNIVGSSGQVWRYNGTGTAILLATIPALAGGGPYDLVGDDQDNFYYLRTQTPQGLHVYNSLGVLTCSYAVTGIATAGAGGGFAIVGNTVTANNGTGYYVGVISGTTVNFTLTPSTYGNPGDFASCYLRTDFPATVTSAPSASISCTNTMVTLTATAPASITPLTYTWSGPGIITSVNNASVNVNAAGVYTCNLSSASCPTKSTSVTFTVINTGSIITPTITKSNNLTCTTPTATLSVVPNTPPHTYTWTGPGIVGPPALSTVVVNAAGVYTVTVNNPVTGCVGTGTISVTSTIGPLTISVSPSNPVKCSTGPGVTLTASGATNYTWTPSATLSSSVGTSVIANPTVTTTYTVRGVTGVCTGSTVITVSVIPSPTINSSATPTAVCAGSPATLSATGATTYTWNPGGLTGANVVVTPTVTTTYTVTGANATCSNTRTVTLVVSPGPTLTATASPTNICSGAATTVTLTSTGAVSYTWNPGGATGATTTVSPTSTTIYTVAGVNASGCRSTRTVTVQVTPTPTLTAVSNPTAICAGSSATLTSTGATTYTWNPGAATGSSTVVSPTLTTTYTVTGANGACTSTRTITLIVNPNPTITASASPTAICSGNSTTLTASGAVTYTWMPGALTGATTVVTPGTTTIYTVTGANASGCRSTRTVTVQVTPTPTLNVTASPTAICVGSSATLSATGATSYTWNPGALTTSSIVVTPTTSTTYTVRGATGSCRSTRTITLIVNPNPTVTAVVSPTAICSESSATLTGGGAVTYTWMPGSITNSNAVVSPTLTTTYTLTGANATGCRNTRTVTLVVNPNPTLTATASPTNICSGAATTVTLTSTGAVSYTWNPGGATGATTTVSPTSTTIYTVTGANASGCRSTRTVTVQVTPTPTLTATSNPTAICAGSSATLTSTGATTYTWNPGAATGSSTVVSPTLTTTYTVTGANGACTSTRTITLIVNPNPTLTASASPTAICSGNSTTLTASGAVTYTWMPGALTGATTVVTPGTTTIYTVTGANASGCRSTRTVTVQVTPTPTLNVTASPTAICVGSSATLSATGATSYTWNPGALTTSSIVVTPTTSTTYTVRGATGTCSSTRTITLIVNPNPTVTAVVSPTAICSGSSATLTGGGAVTYTWMPGSITNSNAVVSPTLTTTYTLTGANATGCRNSRTVTLVVNPNPTLTATASPTNICSGAATTVTLTTSGAVNYLWLPGGMSGSTTTVSPTSTTVYTVVGTSSVGCISNRTVSVLVTPTPTVNITSTPTVLCLGGSATLTATGATNYTWNPGATTGSNVAVSPTLSTTYTVTGANGICTSTQTLSLIVNPNPTITATSSNSVVCSGSSATLTAGGGISYTWTPGALTGTSVVVSPTVSTTYTVIGTSALGCLSTATTNVGVNALPSLTTVATPSAICIADTTTLTVSGALTYTWNPGALTGSIVTVSPGTSTTYTVLGTNANGCIGASTINVNVSSVPVITASGTPTLMCTSSLTSVTLTANGATNYTWTPGIISGSVAVVSPTTSTIYTVTGNNGACNVTATVGVLVINCNNTVFGLTKAAGTPVFVNGDYEVTYTVTAVNASTVSLTNITLNENLNNTFPLPTTYTLVGTPSVTSMGSSLTINPLFNGSTDISLTSPTTSTLLPLWKDTIVFKVKVTPNKVFCPFKNTVIGFATQFGSVVVADSSNNGFIWDPDGDGDPTNNDTMTVVCFEEYTLEIPTGFSPNGDNVNDLFVIKGLNGRKVKLTVFNRWGNKVYENPEYDNTWNGTVNISSVKFGNEKLPQATYFYILEFLDGENEPVTGYVVLQY